MTTWPYPALGRPGWLAGDPDDASLAAVRTAVTTSLGRQPRGAAPDPLDGLRACAELAERLDWAMLALVGQARGAGRSWQEIGTALGVTRQAAHKRFEHWVQEALRQAAGPGGEGGRLSS